jgi:hypothetical protein
VTLTLTPGVRLCAPMIHMNALPSSSGSTQHHGSPFSQFWNDATGFDKGLWLDCYRAHRMAEPLKEDRTRRQPISSTRQRIEWIVEAAKPARVLETNLYARATKQASDLAAEDRESEALAFMLREIAPRVLLLHGNEVGECFPSSVPSTADRDFHSDDRRGAADDGCWCAPSVQRCLSEPDDGAWGRASVPHLSMIVARF